mgnify:CR=1 FL=1
MIVFDIGKWGVTLKKKYEMRKNTRNLTIKN